MFVVSARIIGYFVIHLIITTGSSVGTLNCTQDEGLCLAGCNESKDLKYSSTFCEIPSGSCICDCRDTPASNCTREVDTDCNLYCETKNPNPEVFTYVGYNCPLRVDIQDSICSCMCYINKDYVETNEI